MSGRGDNKTRPQRLFRRGPWEAAATTLIAVGVIMLMQPFSMWAYSNSFGVILTGTLGFVIVSHFRD
ncbi:MAG: hypothetical protein AAF563_03555 [Pseudomonadota bacterium]